MTDRDSFIDEVSEELRRDRMLRAWKRYGPWVIGGLVVLVGAAGAATWLDQKDRAEAERIGAELIRAGEAPDAAARAAEFAGIAEAAGPGEGAALVARLSEAAALAEAGDAAAAAGKFEAIESDGAADPVYRALAGFRAAMLRAADLSPQERVAAMDAHVRPDSPFRLLALERRGVAKLEAGDEVGARADARTALDDPMLSPGLRQRLEQFMTLFG
ncbi:MAG: tetratricopeptide repeat protein, partial [Pseudomonadota bacterium]|nr:tetratricopeptide repeat protein [Pseudomonadota bacterium]